MPPLAAIPIGIGMAVGGAALGSIAAGGIVAGIGSALIGIGVSTALGGVLSLLAPSPKLPSTSSARSRQGMQDLGRLSDDRLNVWDDPVAFKRLIYGETRVGGSAVFRQSHGAKKELLTEVVAVADDEIAGFAPAEDPDVWIDGTRIPLVRNIRAEFPSGEFGPMDDWVPDGGGWVQSAVPGPEGIRGAANTVNGKEGDFWRNGSTNRMYKRENAKWILKADFAGTSKQYISQVAEPSVFIERGSFWLRTSDNKLFELVEIPPPFVSGEAARPATRVWNERATIGGSPNFIQQTIEPSPSSKHRAATKDAGEIWFFRIAFHNGEPGQESDQYTRQIAADHKWTTSHRGEKTAYFRYTIRADPNLYRGKPQVTVRVQGHLVPSASSSWHIQSNTADDRIVTLSGPGGAATAHGLNNGNRIWFSHGRLPSPLKRWHNYYVRNAGTTTFQVSLTAAGTIINLTGLHDDNSRVSRVAYSDNWARCVAHYIAHPYTGLSSTLPPDLDGLTTVNHAVFANSAQVSEEAVSVPGGGTERRYTLNGHVDTSTRPMDMLKVLEVHGGGNIFHDNVGWQILAGAPRPSQMTFKEDEIYGPVTIDPEPGRRDRVNTLVGTFFHPGQGYQPTTGPQVSDPTSIANDGGQVLEKQLDLPFCDSGKRVRRLLLIALKRLRRQETVTFTTSLRALELVNHDHFRLTFDPVLYVGKDFTVETWSYAALPRGHAVLGGGGGEAGLSSEDQEGLGIRLVGIQYDPTVYDNDVDTIEPDPDWRMDVFDPGDVPPPTNLVVFGIEQNPRPVMRNSGEIGVDLLVTWTPPDYDWTRRFDVTWKLYNEGKWKSQEVEGKAEEALIRNAVVGQVYDVAVATIGPGGSRSDNRHPYQTQVRVYASVGRGSLGGPPTTAAVGRNLVSNPNFEQGELNWSLNYTPTDGGTAVVLTDTANAQIGTTALRMTLPPGQTTRARTDEFIPVEWFQKYRFRAWVMWDAGAGLDPPGYMLLNALYYDINKDLITGVTLDRVNTTAVGVAPMVPRTEWYRLKSSHIPDTSTIRYVRFMVRPQNDSATDANAWRVDGAMVREILGGALALVPEVNSLNVSATPGTDGLLWDNVRNIVIATPGDNVTMQFNFDHKYGFNSTAASGAATMQPRLRVIRNNASDGVANEQLVLGNLLPFDAYTSNGNAFATNSTAWQGFSLTAVEEDPPPGHYIYRLQVSTNHNRGAISTKNRDAWYRLE